MMYLITGMPGNGKTLYAVSFIRDEVKKGRTVFTDIKGITLEGVQPIPDDGDWRKLPDGSIVVYDEAHKRFPAFKGKGRSPLEVVQQMDEHRHRGFDLMFITQWPEKVDQELFTLIGTHEHLSRAFGLQQANKVQFNRGVKNPYSASARKGADEIQWPFPKDLYKCYASSSMHTDAHKFKMPKKVIHACISSVFIALGLWGFWWFFAPKTPDKPETPVSEERSEAETMSGRARQSISELRIADIDLGATPPHLAPIAGCVSGRHGCRCFTTEGHQIDQTPQQCDEMLAGPLRLNLYHQYSTSAPNYTADARSVSQRDDGDIRLGPGTAALGNAEIASYGDYGVQTGRYVGQGVRM